MERFRFPFILSGKKRRHRRLELWRIGSDKVPVCVRLRSAIMLTVESCVDEMGDVRVFIVSFFRVGGVRP